jgi:TonB family protein
VTLSFTVSETGKVTDVKVLRGVHKDLDNEAVRVVSSSPDWTPGEANGKVVAVSYTFPIIFQTKKPENSDVVPFQFADTKPGFNGGDVNEFSKWVAQHLVYPETCKKEGISGRVTMSFTVSETGKVTDVKVLRGVHKDLDNEAIRVVSSSPDWTPGIADGKAVAIKYTFPVLFQADKAE